MNRTLKDNIRFLCVGAAGGNVGQMLDREERIQSVLYQSCKTGLGLDTQSEQTAYSWR